MTSAPALSLVESPTLEREFKFGLLAKAFSQFNVARFLEWAEVPRDNSERPPSVATGEDLTGIFDPLQREVFSRKGELFDDFHRHVLFGEYRSPVNELSSPCLCK